MRRNLIQTSNDLIALRIWWFWGNR
jgi:hypothetical protein